MGKTYKLRAEDLQYAIEKINYWYKKNIKFLSIITSPFNTSCIFSDIIKMICNNGGKVLYIWGEDHENKELIEFIKIQEFKISYSTIKNGASNSDLIFVHYLNVDKLEGKYDLIIYDDITCFSNISCAYIRDIIDICSNKSERMIVYSIEKLSLIGEKFEFAAYDYEKPFLEPRVITTRIDLHKDIPYSVYDYIKWFTETHKKVAVCVPDIEKIDNVYEYFKNKLKLKNSKIIKVCGNDEIKKTEKVSIIKDKAIFIITNKIEELLKYCHINNAVVLFSNDMKFNYKRIVYMCGKIRILNDEIPEVLLVCNEESTDMEKAKKMARNFNKKVWEKKLKEL